MENMAKYGWVKLSDLLESDDLMEEFRFLGEFFIYIDAGFSWLGTRMVSCLGGSIEHL